MRERAAQDAAAAILVLFALTASPERALAEGSNERLSVRPSVKVSLVANDNVSWQAKDQKSDFSGWLEPRLAVDYERPHLRLGADVAADLRYSLDHRELRHAFYDARAWAEWEPLRGLSVRLSDSYVPQAVRLAGVASATERKLQAHST